MNLYAILGGLAALAFAFGCGMATNGYMRDAEDNAELVKTQAALIKVRADNDAHVAKLNQEQSDEIARINDRHRAELDRLRKRPARMPESSRGACKGATGAELSGPDGGFLSGESARANEQREALAKCYAWIDKVKGADSFTQPPH